MKIWTCERKVDDGLAIHFALTYSVFNISRRRVSQLQSSLSDVRPLSLVYTLACDVHESKMLSDYIHIVSVCPCVPARSTIASRPVTLVARLDLCQYPISPFLLAS